MKLQFFNNLEKLDYKNPEHTKNLMQALQFYMSLPDLYIPQLFRGDDALSILFRKTKKKFMEERRLKQLQEFGKPSDFPASVLPVIEKFHAVPDYDNFYEEIFDIRDYSGSKRNGFEVGTVQSGLTFGRYQQGNPIQVYQMSGTKETCYFDLYGGALSWSRILFDDEDWWTIEDNAKEFVSVAYNQRAGIFYALIEAISTIKGCCAVVPANCTDCQADALSIAYSLNFAAQTILINNQNKGYGITAQNIQMIVLTPVQMRGRVRAGLNIPLGGYGGPAAIDFNFRQITSLMLSSANRVYVILPKLKMKGGYRMDLTLFNDFDILTYADVQAGWLRYGGCIADADQIECIDFELQSGSCPP